MPAFSHPDTTEEIIEHATDQIVSIQVIYYQVSGYFPTVQQTQAMTISTQHLMPMVAPTPAVNINSKTATSTPQPASGMTSQTKDGGLSFRVPHEGR